MRIHPENPIKARGYGVLQGRPIKTRTYDFSRADYLGTPLSILLDLDMLKIGCWKGGSSIVASDPLTFKPLKMRMRF